MIEVGSEMVGLLSFKDKKESTEILKLERLQTADFGESSKVEKALLGKIKFPIFLIQEKKIANTKAKQDSIKRDSKATKNEQKHV